MMRRLQLVVVIVLLSVWPADAAVICLTGLETGASNESQTQSGTESVQSTTKRTGGYALRSNPTTTAVGWEDFPGNDTSGAFADYNVATAYYRVYFRYATKPSANDEPILQVRSVASTLKFELRINSSGNLVAYDTTPTIISTGSTALSSGTWYRLELKVGTGASAAWELKIDGTVELSGTNNLTASNNALIRLGKAVNRNGQTVDFFYDDILVRDDDYPGAGAIEAMQPDGDGVATAWTIGAGSGADYTNIDEIPSDGDTTYLLSTLVINEASMAALESASTAGISGTINGVKGWWPVKRDGAANGTVILRLRSASTNSDTAGLGSTSAYLHKMLYFATDPATGSTWTTSGLDGVELGALEGEATDRTRLTAVALFVDFNASATGTSKHRTLLGVGDCQ